MADVYPAIYLWTTATYRSGGFVVKVTTVTRLPTLKGLFLPQVY